MASNAKNLAELLNTDSTVAVGDIADGSVSTAKLADDAVTSAKLGASAVDATALASNAVATAKIADGAVTQAKTTGVGKGKNVLINGNFDVWKRYGANIILGKDFLHDYFELEFSDFRQRLNLNIEHNNKTILNRIIILSFHFINNTTVHKDKIDIYIFASKY